MKLVAMDLGYRAEQSQPPRSWWFGPRGPASVGALSARATATRRADPRVRVRQRRGGYRGGHSPRTRPGQPRNHHRLNQGGVMSIRNNWPNRVIGVLIGSLVAAAFFVPAAIAQPIDAPGTATPSATAPPPLPVAVARTASGANPVAQ